MTYFSKAKNKISGKIWNRFASLVLAATIIAGGFFVANFAFAAHTATITRSPSVIKGGTETGQFEFTITNNGSDSIKRIIISIPAGFTGVTANCPTNWWILPSSTEIKCQDVDGGNEISL